MAQKKTTALKKPAPRRSITRQLPEVRRQDLLLVTIDCLARLGPRGTTGREICRQAGVSHGLLRHYFNNPENLLLETYQELCDQVIACFKKEAAAPAEDPWETVDRFFAVQFSHQWANSDILGAWIAFWTLVRSNEDFARVSEDHNGKLRVMLGEAVKRLPPGPITPENLASMLSAMMDGLWLDFCLSPARLSRERAIELGRLALRQFVPQPINPGQFA